MSELSRIVAKAIGHGFEFEVNLKNKEIAIAIDGPTVHEAGYGSVCQHHKVMMGIKVEEGMKIVKHSHNKMVLGPKN